MGVKFDLLPNQILTLGCPQALVVHDGDASMGAQVLIAFVVFVFLLSISLPPGFCLRFRLFPCLILFFFFGRFLFVYSVLLYVSVPALRSFLLYQDLG